MTKDNGLSARQIGFITALLGEPSIAAAGRACNVPKSTAARWLAEADFKKALDAARAEVFKDGLAIIKAAARAAALELVALLKARDPSVRRLAADSILRAAFKGHEALELESRVEALENNMGATP